MYITVLYYLHVNMFILPVLIWTEPVSQMVLFAPAAMILSGPMLLLEFFHTITMKHMRRF